MLESSTRQVTGIVLAGGHSRRLGRDKAVEEIGGIRIIDRVIETLNNCCENILVIGDRPERRSELSLPGNVMFEHDTNIGKGSLGGLYTGLRASKTQWTLAVACDMPFLCYELIEELKNRANSDICDAVVPVVNGRFQPTHSVYSQNCVSFIDKCIGSGHLRMDGYFSDIRVSRVSDDVINGFTGGLNSFFNVNTESDLQTAHSIVGELSS